MANSIAVQQALHARNVGRRSPRRVINGCGRREEPGGSGRGLLDIRCVEKAGQRCMGTSFGQLGLHSARCGESDKPYVEDRESLAAA